MSWSHFLVAVLVLAVGYWLGSKYPGGLSKLTGGAVAA